MKLLWVLWTTGWFWIFPTEFLMVLYILWKIFPNFVHYQMCWDHNYLTSDTSVYSKQNSYQFCGPSIGSEHLIKKLRWWCKPSNSSVCLIRNSGNFCAWINSSANYYTSPTDFLWLMRNFISFPHLSNSTEYWYSTSNGCLDCISIPWLFHEASSGISYLPENAR